MGIEGESKFKEERIHQAGAKAREQYNKGKILHQRFFAPGVPMLTLEESVMKAEEEEAKQIAEEEEEKKLKMEKID